MMRRLSPALALLLVYGLGGCASAAINRLGDDDDDYADEEPGDAGDDDDFAGDDDDDPPPEEEAEFLPRPMTTDVYVFVPNPERDTVSKINAHTRDITTVGVGDEPTRVLISEDWGTVAVLNEGDDSVSLIDPADDTVVELAVREDFNDIAMSPDGRWVIAWFNEDLEDADFSVEGVRSYTEISIVDTVEQSVQSASVGFNPQGIRFTDDSDRAVILTDMFFTLVELTPEGASFSLIDLDTDPLDPPRLAEVLLSPGGDKALVRHQGLDALKLVELDSGLIEEIEAGIDPSDMDPTPDGTQAVVVSRGSQELRIYELSDPTLPPVILPTPESELIGSVILDPTGQTGLLYTTAALTDRVTFWDVASDEMSIRPVVKPVANIGLAPDGRSALILHTLADVAGESDLYSDHYALSVVDLETSLINAVLLESRPTSWATSDDGDYSMFIMENNRNVGVIDYRTRLVDDVRLPSVPAFVGMMPLLDPAEPVLGWVSQEHELGRISFVTPESLEVTTITGFELNSVID